MIDWFVTSDSVRKPLYLACNLVKFSEATSSFKRLLNYTMGASYPYFAVMTDDVIANDGVGYLLFFGCCPSTFKSF